MKKFERCELAEGLMWADGVVDEFPVGALGTQCGDVEGLVGAAVEVVLVGALEAFDAAIELGGTRRQDEKAEAALLAEGGVSDSDLTATAAYDGEHRRTMKRVKMATLY